MTLQLILTGLNFVLICFWVYMYARTKGKQEQYEKEKNSFIGHQIDTICAKLVELESKHGELLKERRCVQLDNDTMEILSHIDMIVTTVSMMVTDNKIKECEEKEDFDNARNFRSSLDCDKKYLLNRMLREMKGHASFAEIAVNRLKEMAKKYDKDHSESDD